MILEIAILIVNQGQEKAFEASFNQAQSIIASMPGYKKHCLKRSADAGHKYLLMVWWEDIDDHRRNFRKSEKYQEWKNILHKYYNPVPKVEYFEDKNIFP